MIFLLILPIFGKGIDYQESLVFYGLPVFFGISLIGSHNKFSLPSVKLQLLVIFLYFITVLFSVNIGASYYQFINFLTVLFIFNLGTVYLKSDNHLQNGIVIASIIFSLVSIIYKFFIPTLFSQEFSDNVFVQNWGHSYIADFLIFSFVILINNIQPKKIFPTIFLLIPITIAIILSNSRSSIVALIMGILFLKSNHPNHQLTKILAIFCLLFSLAYIFFFSNYLKSPNGSRPEYWSQAISGFISSPFVGVGPGNFGIINRQYRQSITNSANYAHSSFLESLSGQGIFFTLVFFGLVGYGLVFQFQHNRLFFSLGFMSLCNSLLDPSWSSPGILAISLVFIFWRIKTKPLSKIYLFSLTLVILLFLISKTVSDILQNQGRYELSLKFDPFNPSSLSQLIDTRQAQIKTLYRQDPYFLNQLSQPKYLPQNETIFYESFRLDPKGSTNHLLRLVYFYSSTNNFSQLKSLSPLVYSRIDSPSLPFNMTLELAKSIYKLGLYEWELKNYSEAIAHFEKAVVYSRNWSHFELEYTTALWHNGQTQKALDNLINCQKNSASVKHCREFESELKKSGWPKVGEFSQTISTFYAPPDGETPTNP